MKDSSQYHHRGSTRLPGYDYSKKGLYFITICTHEKMPAFGFIENAIMHLNDAGRVAKKCWLDIPVHYPNVVLHDFIIMPDHIHGIVELVNNGRDRQHGRIVGHTGMVGGQNIEPVWLGVGGVPDNCMRSDVRVQNNVVGVQNNVVGVQNNVVGVQNFEPLRSEPQPPSQCRQHPKNHKQHENQKIIPRSVGSIIRGYKIGVTKWFRENQMGSRIWQRNYYEHIIRDDQSYDRISKYIIDNPCKWID